MFGAIEAFGRDERGAAAVEYGLVLTLVALSVFLIFGDIGIALNNALNEVVDTINTAVANTSRAG